MENKCDERCRALDQRKREAFAAEEQQRMAEQLQLLKMEAKVKAIQEHALLFYGHNALVKLAATGVGIASAGSSGSSVTRPLPPRSTAPPTAPFGYLPGAGGAVLVPATGWVTGGGRVHDRAIAFVY
jgi:hypothetical protein